MTGPGVFYFVVVRCVVVSYWVVVLFCLDLYMPLCVSVYSTPEIMVNICVFFYIFMCLFVIQQMSILFLHIFCSFLCDDVIPGGCIPGTGAEVNGANGSG